MRASPVLVGLLALALGPGPGEAGDEAWIDLATLDAWKSPIEGWAEAGSVAVDAKDDRKLAQGQGRGLFTNAPEGHARNLVSKETFGDVAVHLEFFIPKGSNSGIKFQSVYEVQIFDSHAIKALRGTDCGAIYPRSEQFPLYHHLDNGYPPLVNASRPAGEWQELDLIFIAPRFDAEGAKIADARISATLNGRKVQDDRKVPCPTGANWNAKEKATGPLLLQADHGPVAFRNVKARKLATTP